MWGTWWSRAPWSNSTISSTRSARPSACPFLTVVGNHDLGKDQDLTLYREIFGPDYYAFPLKDNYFIVVNDVET